MEFKTKSFEDACKLLNKSTALPEVSMVDEEYRNKIIAHHQRMILTEAINYEANGHKKWIPDYTNGSLKYEVWVWIKADENNKSGFGFAAPLTFYDRTRTYSGSRLSFFSEKAAYYYINQFEDNLKADMLY